MAQLSLFINESQSHAFEHSCILDEPHFNLSHASLQSLATLQALKMLSKTDPVLWAELSQTDTATALPTNDPNEVSPSEAPDNHSPSDGFEDNLSIPLTILHQHILTGDSKCGHIENADGNLSSQPQ